MKKNMLNILDCPIDKFYTLELFEINMNSSIDKDQSTDIIIDGILFCSKCSRYYPIIDKIPIMLPDELRDKTIDIEFLKKWKHKIPEKVLNHGIPWHL
jgi:uncharacterized protein YbaR (Trm112 family)